MIKIAVNKYLKAFSLVLLIAFIGQNKMEAQQGTLNRNHNEQVTIVGTYDPTINQAFKINLKPEIPEIVTQKPEFTFQSLEVKQATTIQPLQIKPARLSTRNRIEIYNNYVKAGFGSWMTPVLDFYHSSGEKNDNRLNILFSHISSFKDIPDYSPSPYSKTKATISYDKNIGKSILNLGASYGLDTYQYYGFIPADYPWFDVPESDLKQMFNLVKANVGLTSNNRKKNSFEYNTKLETYYYFDKWQTSTYYLDLNFDLSQPFDAGKRDDFQQVGLKGDILFGIDTDSIQSTNDLLLTGIPYYQAKFGILNFSLGLNFSYLMADSSTFHFYPMIDVAVNLVPDALTIYAGSDGGLVKNNYYTLTQINPWAYCLTPVTWQNNKLRVYAGLRGNIASQLGYNFEVSWLNFENMPFFVNIPDQPPVWGVTDPLNKFTTVNDNGNVLRISGELNYAVGNELNVWLGGSYNIYTLDTLAKPYQKPITSVNFGASYLIKKKVKVWAEIIGSGKRYAADYYDNVTEYPAQNPEVIDLNGYIDINAGVDVYITEKFSVFVKATNLLNNNYERFYNYPVQGLQVFGGIGYRF